MMVSRDARCACPLFDRELAFGETHGGIAGILGDDPKPAARFAALIAEDKELIEAFHAIRTHLEGSFAQMSQQMRMIGLSD